MPFSIAGQLLSVNCYIYTKDQDLLQILAYIQ